MYLYFPDRPRINDYTEALTDERAEDLLTLLKRFAGGGAKRRDNNYSKTPLIRINCDSEPSGCAENPDNWFFL
jgi:hypothetical protein